MKQTSQKILYNSEQRERGLFNATTAQLCSQDGKLCWYEIDPEKHCLFKADVTAGRKAKKEKAP